jgi:hypothetical protein
MIMVCQDPPATLDCCRGVKLVTTSLLRINFFFNSTLFFFMTLLYGAYSGIGFSAFPVLKDDDRTGG